MITQLQANQLAITTGLEKIDESNRIMIDMTELPRFEAIDGPEPLLQEAIKEPKAKEKFTCDTSIGFDEADINFLYENKLPLPQDLPKEEDYDGLLDDIDIWLHL